MGKYEKKSKKSGGAAYEIMLALCGVMLVVVIVLAVLVFGGSGGENEALPEQTHPLETTAPETQHTEPSAQPETETTAAPTEPVEGDLQVLSVEQQGEYMVVTTSYCVLKYPYAFSDVIQVDAVYSQDTSALEFSAVISDMDIKLFALCFDSSEGMPLGSLTVEDKTFSVSVVLYEADADLDPGSHDTFYAAQESFNDVMASLTENEGFAPAG